MDENVIFDKLDKELDEMNEDLINKENNSEAFVSGLPDWDLEPLYETLDRGDS